MKDINDMVIEEVAKFMINRDADFYGDVWPWPEGNEPWEIEAREKAKSIAKLAIEACLTVGGFVWRP